MQDRCYKLASHARRASLIAACVLLAACVMVPKTTYRYDAECQVVARHMTLEPVQIAAFGGCSNSGCASLLAVAGVTAAASAVVSGSIAVIGNVVYWLERQGQCRGREAT